MKSNLKVELKELPHKGLDLNYSRETTKLTEKLTPLLGDNDYDIQAHICHAGPSSYVITGEIKTQLSLLCARCAYDFKKPLHKKFKEKIHLQKKLTRIDKNTKSNHFSELVSQENWTLIENSCFEMGDFLYELIAIEEPLRPLRSKTCDDDNSSCKYLEEMKKMINQKGNSQIHFF